MGRLARRATHTSREQEVQSLRHKYRIMQRQYNKSIQWIKLDKPEQAGYERFFVVRDDVLRSAEGQSFKHLLTFINCTEYSRDKEFTHIKRGRYRRHARRRKQVRVKTIQTVKRLTKKEMNKVPEKFHKHFSHVVTHSKRRGIENWWYVDKPWRFVLKIQPYMVTHYRVSDEALWAEMEVIWNRLYSENSELYRYGRYHYTDKWYRTEVEQRRRTAEIREMIEAKDEVRENTLETLLREHVDEN